MNTKELVINVKKLISQDEISKAISLLFDNMNEPPLNRLENEIIILTNSYHSIRRKNLGGRKIKDEDINDLIFKILLLLEEIDRPMNPIENIDNTDILREINTEKRNKAFNIVFSVAIGGVLSLSATISIAGGVTLLAVVIFIVFYFILTKLFDGSD